jgi:hypothetical protein
MVYGQNVSNFKDDRMVVFTYGTPLNSGTSHPYIMILGVAGVGNPALRNVARRKEHDFYGTVIKK